MNRWLDAVENDKRKLSLEEKIAAHRPEDVHDRCTSIEALEEYVQEIELPGIGKVCESPLLETRFATPRVVAGESLTTDNQECKPKPLKRSNYTVTFTEEAWAQLQQAFPTGVCNFAKPGVGQQRTIPGRPTRTTMKMEPCSSAASRSAEHPPTLANAGRAKRSRAG